MMNKTINDNLFKSLRDSRKMNDLNLDLNNFEFREDLSGIQQKYYSKTLSDNGVFYKIDTPNSREALSEEIASALYENSNLKEFIPEYIKYRIVSDNNGKIGVLSENFLNKGESFLALNTLFNSDTIKDTLKSFNRFEYVEFISNELNKNYNIDLERIKKWLVSILLFDRIIMNPDRKLDNLCLVQKTDGTYKLGPLFDNGASFLSMHRKSNNELFKNDLSKKYLDHICMLPCAFFGDIFMDNTTNDVITMAKNLDIRIKVDIEYLYNYILNLSNHNGLYEPEDYVLIKNILKHNINIMLRHRVLELY